MRTYRRNADADLRELERRAAAGDERAQDALERARERLRPSPTQVAERQAWEQLADHPHVKSFLLAAIRTTLNRYKQSGAERGLLTRDPVLDKSYTRIFSGPFLDSIYDPAVDYAARSLQGQPEAHATLRAGRGGYEVVVDVYVRDVEEDDQDQIYYELESALEHRDEALQSNTDAKSTQGDWDADMNYDEEERELNVTFSRPLELYHLSTLGLLDVEPDEPRERRPKRRRKYRRNADEDLRARERRAASGSDAESKAAAARARRRAGEDVSPGELDPIGQIFLQAFLMGKEGRVEARRKGGVKTGVERFYVGANRLPDRGNVSRGPMHPFASPAFFDWRPWVESEGVVVVPQEPVQIDTNGPLDTLYKIAAHYNLTPDEVWAANVRSEVEWPDKGNHPSSLRGIHPFWTEWDEVRRQGTRPPGAWATGHYGAWIDTADLSYPERWRFENLYDPWIQSGTIDSWGSAPHWITVPTSGRWSVLFRATHKQAGRNEYGSSVLWSSKPLRPSDYEWARIMTKKGKAWKNPRRSP